VISPVNVADDMGAQFLGEGVDLGVQLQFCSLFLEVVVSLCLLECGGRSSRMPTRRSPQERRQASTMETPLAKPGCDRADGLLVAERASSITNFNKQWMTQVWAGTFTAH
jgi:hypothetical protein